MCLGTLQHAIGQVCFDPLPINLRLSQRDCPTSGPEGEDMKSVPYAPIVGSLMYAMVATRYDITHVVGVVSRFMHNPG